MKKNTHLTKKKMTGYLGEVLREARLKAELTQADVAERVGMATEVYGRIERGNLTPSVPSLRRLCVALRVDANAVLNLTGYEAATWLQESEPTPEESPQLRRLLRTLRQLDDKQLSAVGYMARSLVSPEAG
ncbi:transcriptional regulator [Archangium sp. Cb G35]|uniref:helix-turn-helix transcriptional regulator n=1 Tax=Archangium sp. Cb G35 TaxID=1920190 RepID=UPI0009369571|nr:helix-turn-helix transcriptional regulator [Archangium sp. Cb G35]OJT16415.1 transcriptional regulator [Archangium sp. Cb G35]